MVTAAATFNSDLYTVAATVIPVFLIALVIEGSFFRGVVFWIARRATERAVRKGLAGRTVDEALTSDGPFPFHARTWIVGWLLVFPVSVILAIATRGELGAVHALDHQRATQSEHDAAMIALVVLPIVTAAGALGAAVLPGVLAGLKAAFSAPAEIDVEQVERMDPAELPELHELVSEEAEAPPEDPV